MNGLCLWNSSFLTLPVSNSDPSEIFSSPWPIFFLKSYCDKFNPPADLDFDNDLKRF